MALLDKLAMIKLRFDDVAQQIIEPEVIADPSDDELSDATSVDFDAVGDDDDGEDMTSFYNNLARIAYMRHRSS